MMPLQDMRERERGPVDRIDPKAAVEQLESPCVKAQGST
jgi:hypothetical protein